CTRLQRQHTEMLTKIAAQDLEISNLKAKINMLENKDEGGAEPSGEDALIKGRSLETREEAAREIEEQMAREDQRRNKQIARDAKIMRIHAEEELQMMIDGLDRNIEMIANPIFTTASVVTPYSRRKGKEKMVESDTPKKKKLQEQIDVQIAREIEEQMAREDQRRNKQIARDAEIMRIHAEEELQMMIDGLDRNIEMIAKYLHEYEQVAAQLTIGEKIELINELVKYQDHHSKILNHSGWKTKHFKGMSLEEIREKFILVWKQIEDFVPMASKEEGERFKRKGLRLEQRSPKKMKTTKKDLKEMMQLVPVEEVYVEALQVKHPIIDWEIHSEGQRNYWKIIRLGGSIAVYQFFVDMLKHIDREDLIQLWTLVKETVSIRHATMMKFPLPEYFPTASEDMFPLLSERDAPAEEVWTADEVKD
nr:hypothetical protein [Tanacetum cinerariifolium]